MYTQHRKPSYRAAVLPIVTKSKATRKILKEKNKLNLKLVMARFEDPKLSLRMSSVAVLDVLDELSENESRIFSISTLVLVLVAEPF